MRLTSATALAAAYQHASGETIVVLAEFSHQDLRETIYVANNTRPIVSGGVTYHGIPFSFEIVTDSEQPPRGEIAVQNVAGWSKAAGDNPDAAPVVPTISEMVLALGSPVNVDIKFVLASSPDTIEEEINGLQVRDLRADTIQVRGTLTSKQYDREPATKMRVRQEAFPGAYV
jgi:hypothetical protein